MINIIEITLPNKFKWNDKVSLNIVKDCVTEFMKIYDHQKE